MTELDASIGRAFERAFDSLEALADTISESLQSQVTIEDDHHNVIGYSSHQLESDTARLSTIIERRVPNSVLSGLRKKGILQLLESVSHSVRIPAINEIGLGARLAVCIKNNHAVLGYIWVVDTGNLVEGHAERVVEKSAEIAKRFLLKQRSWKAKQDKTHDEFIWKLLTDYYQSDTMIRKDAEALSLLLPDCYHIVVFECNVPISDEKAARLRLALTAKSQARLACLTASQNHLIAILSLYSTASNKADLTSFIHTFVQGVNEKKEVTFTAFGCSGKYDKYTRASNAYKETLHILSLKKLLPFHTRQVVHYDDLGFLMHVPSIIEHKKNSDYSSPLLQVLREHDRESKSDFMKTLATYLSLNCNAKDTAALLHIHANTLNYRLNRISEITGQSLKNSNDFVSIYLDILTEETSSINQWLPSRQDRND